MDDATLCNVVERLIRGDVSQVSVVRSVSHSTLERSCSNMTFELTSVAVVEVLQRLAAGDITDAEAQLWASFVQKGFAEGAFDGPIRPLQIDWMIEHEDAIAEALSRLDELGDVIDGTIDASEIRSLIDSLGGSK